MGTFVFSYDPYNEPLKMSRIRACRSTTSNFKFSLSGKWFVKAWVTACCDLSLDRHFKYCHLFPGVGILGDIFWTRSMRIHCFLPPLSVINSQEIIMVLQSNPSLPAPSNLFLPQSGEKSLGTKVHCRLYVHHVSHSLIRTPTCPAILGQCSCT